jgi:serine/threonine-protein kinase
MLGRMLLELGDVAQAIMRLEAALLLDPTSVAPEFELARAHALLGEWAQVDEIHARPQLDALTRAISRARLALWRRERAPVAPADTPPDSYQRLWCEVLTTPSLSPDQRAWMRGRTDKATGRLRTLFWQRNAEVLAFVGDGDAALDAVEQTLAVGLIDLTWIDRCPLFDDARTSPRWRPVRAALAERIAPIAAALDVTVQP